MAPITTELDREETRRTGGDYDQWVFLGYYAPDFRLAVNDELDRVASLAENWDGQGARTLDPAVVDAARQFVARLPDNIAMPPAVVPMAKGNLQFEWHDGPRTLELEIESPTTIHYLKWDSEQDLEEEHFFDIGDISQAELLLRWFMGGVAHV